MRRLLLTLPLLLALPLAAAADPTEAPEVTLGDYRALTLEERALYLAGVADALDLAAAMADNQRLRIIAACTHGFDGDELRAAVEEGAGNPLADWPEETPAAGWFVASMIQVCQLQLPPE